MHQLLIRNRARQRVRCLRAVDRVIASICAAWINPVRLLRCPIILKPATIMSRHRSLARRKYRWLYTPKRGGKSGPKDPSPGPSTSCAPPRSRVRAKSCNRPGLIIRPTPDWFCRAPQALRTGAGHAWPTPDQGPLLLWWRAGGVPGEDSNLKSRHPLCGIVHSALNTVAMECRDSASVPARRSILPPAKSAIFNRQSAGPHVIRRMSWNVLVIESPSVRRALPSYRVNIRIRRNLRCTAKDQP